MNEFIIEKSKIDLTGLLGLLLPKGLFGVLFLALLLLQYYSSFLLA